MADFSVPPEMQGKTQLLYLFDERKKGNDLFDAIAKWDAAHPLPVDLYPSEEECWRFLDHLRSRGSLTPGELRTLQFATQESMDKALREPAHNNQDDEA